MEAAALKGFAHVGLPKTGSTYLQRQYFSRLPGIKLFSTTAPYIWPRDLRFTWPVNWFWYDDLTSPGPLLTADQRSSRFEAKVEPFIEQWQASCTTFRVSSRSIEQWILSAEGLCGSAPPVNALQMKLLKQAGVEKLLFVCRQQAAFAQSLWRQFLLAENRLARFVPFDVFFGAEGVDGVMGLDWMPYVQSMDAEFGRQNVLVLPYELMKHDPKCFFRTLNTFLGLPSDFLIPDPSVVENPSRNDSLYRGLALDQSAAFARLPWVRRRLHSLATRLGHALPRAWRSTHSMAVTPEALEALQHRFQAANTQLEQRIGLDLQRFGYC